MGSHKVVLMAAVTCPTKWVLSNNIVIISYYKLPKTSILLAMGSMGHNEEFAC